MLWSRSFKKQFVVLRFQTVLFLPEQLTTLLVSLWHSDIIQQLKLLIISWAHWADTLRNWKPVRQNTLFLMKEALQNTHKISPVHPVKAHAEFEVQLHSFWTSALGWAWHFAALTLGKEPLLPNELGGASKLVWMRWRNGLLPLSEIQPQFL
jgi:hypothetical protein